MAADKVRRAKCLLIELESLQSAEGIIHSATLLNEVLRDAKCLAEQVTAEAESAQEAKVAA